MRKEKGQTGIQMMIRRFVLFPQTSTFGGSTQLTANLHHCRFLDICQVGSDSLSLQAT